MATHHLAPEVYYYTFAAHRPALRIQSGDTVVAQTRDAGGGDADGNPMPEEMKQRVAGTALRESNPVVGPVYVEGAEKGDALAVHIRRIRLTRERAYSKQSAGFGSLTGETPGYSLLYNDPIANMTFDWDIDLSKNTATLGMPGSRLKQVEVELDPFIGSIGVAPPFGQVEMTLSPGKFGGNMDCVDTREGTTLILPVWVDGGYLCFGDIHAVQGDGELNGTALEITAEVRLEIALMKQYSMQWPRMVDATHIMVAASTRPLFDSVRLAQIELLNWLVGEYGFNREEAWQLNSQVGTMRIGNLVDPFFTVVAKFPKKHLPSD